MTGTSTSGKPRKARARKRPRGAPCHVISVPVGFTPANLALVNRRLEAGRRLYNACLGEALRRCDRVHTDPMFEAAKKLPRGPAGSERAKTRLEAFEAVNAAHGFSGAEINAYGSSLRTRANAPRLRSLSARRRKTWMSSHVGGQQTQVLATRAFGAVERFGRGQGGKPRFKPARRGLRSAYGKDLKGEMVPLVDHGMVIGVRWSMLELRFLDGVGQSMPETLTRLQSAHETSRILTCGVVKTVVKGRPTLRASFTVDGKPPQRHPVGKGKVATDVGPSSLAVVVAGADGQPVPEAIGHYELAPGLCPPAAKLRRLQRHLDRQHRAGSQGCFRPDGTHKSGVCHWKQRSKAAQSTQAQIDETYRRLAAGRKTAHGELANVLLGYGADLYAEDLNYTSWVKMFPRSIRDRAVGSMMAGWSRKAENAGGSHYRINPYTTALSQTCICGNKQRKLLSERWHRCPLCGRQAQRDLFSAYLALFVVRNEAGEDVLDFEGAAQHWDAFAPHLQEAGGVSGSSQHKQLRGRVHRPGRRNMARIKARRQQRTKHATEGCGTTPAGTAVVATRTAVAA